MNKLVSLYNLCRDEFYTYGRILDPFVHKKNLAYYVMNPLDDNLRRSQKVIACTLSAIVFIGTLGMFHVGSWINKKIEQIHYDRITSNPNHQKHIQLIQKTNRVVRLHQVGPQLKNLSRENVSNIIQTRVIDPYYSKPLPSYQDVSVPPPDSLSKEQQAQVESNGLIKWNLLSREQKIEVINKYALPNVKIQNMNLSESKVDEYLFTPYGHHSNASSPDPRGAHGSDHAVRVSLWSAVFAYLYEKYHPTIAVDSNELLVGELVASFHDSGRQTEGVDVYDDVSAKNAVGCLHTLQIDNKELLHAAEEAIANKDSLDFAKKPLIAKIVQNSDSADYARILLRGPVQEKSQFDDSRKFLDIFKELNQLASGDPNFILKNGLKFKDFLEELDALRSDMNKVIDKTKAQSFRKVASKPGENYRVHVLNEIKYIDHPHLYSVLSDVGVIKKSDKDITDELSDLYRFGVKELSVTHLENCLKTLNDLPLSSIVKKLIVNYTEALQNKKTLSQEPDSFSEELIKKLLETTDKSHEAFISKKVWSSWLESTETTPKTRFDLCNALNIYVQQLEQHIIEPHLIDQIAELVVFMHQQVDLLDDAFDKTLFLSTIAFHYERIANYYLTNHDTENAHKILAKAAQIPITAANQFYDMAGLMEKFTSKPGHLISDSSLLRKRRLRCQEKAFDTQATKWEFSFEIPQEIRKNWEKIGYLEFLKSIPGASLEESTYGFEKFNSSNNTFHSDQKHILKVGKAHILKLPNGIEMTFGAEMENFNVAHLVRLRAPKGMSPQDIHKTFCSIGLPTTLMQSRPVDAKREIINKLIHSYHTDKVYETDPRRTPEEVYHLLSTEQQEELDQLAELADIEEVNTNHYELVQPQLPQRLWNQGARGFIHTLHNGQLDQTLDILVRVLNTGLLSTIERYQAGMVSGLGTCPMTNIRTGSANQVFSRIITDEWLKKRYNLDYLPHAEASVMLIFDIDAAKRMPYAYHSDFGGQRNPDLHYPEFGIPGGDTHYDIKSIELLRQRRALPQHIAHINSSTYAFDRNECMMDQTLGAKFINKIIVSDEATRFKTMRKLRENGFDTINGIKLEDFVVATHHLDEKIVSAKR